MNQPKPKKDWVAIIKKNIEANDEYREAKAFADARHAAVLYYEAFLETLQVKADRGEYVDPKAFEKEVISYANKIAAPAVADLIYAGFMERRKIRRLSEQLLQEGIKHIDRQTTLAIDRMENSIKEWLDNQLKAQQERLDFMEKIKEEQDIYLMRAVTLKEEAEKYRYKWTFSPLGQYRNLRNLFKRHALLKEAEQAFHAYRPKTVQDIALEAYQMQEETVKEFEAEIESLRESFNAAKEKISGLDHGDMDILDTKLRNALDNCRDNLVLARLELARTVMDKKL